ncbi:MAG: Hsp20/alpha crystallin family protein [Rubritalea sp.]|uniref:Hsp20/alpha crystallin family protein n=1 Tax=Rubritalea sp. TaxID=2109375 RepID=UPI00324233DB
MRTFSPFTTRSLFSELNNFLEECPKREAHQLYTTDSGWVVRIDLPGFEKSDLALYFEESALHLIAEKPEGSEQTRPATHHKFALGNEVNSLSITAKLENGVLEVTLPRKEEVAANKNITIQ